MRLIRMVYDVWEDRWKAKRFGMFGILENINAGVEECMNTQSAILIDVREKDEYDSGHIPGAVNVPLSSIQNASFPKTVPLFVYCQRGSRSKKAVSELKKNGYENAKSIGGIKDYHGDLETRSV